VGTVVNKTLLYNDKKQEAALNKMAFLEKKAVTFALYMHDY
jgi:hypothetical protein